MMDKIQNMNLGYNLFETFTIHNGKIVREEFHKRRLISSLKTLGWGTATFWDQFIESKIKHITGTQRGKLIIVPNNDKLDWSFEQTDLPSYPEIIRLNHLPECVRHSKDPFWKLKMGGWQRNLHQLLNLPTGIDDVIFINEKDEVCETTKANIYLLQGEFLITPPLSSGLLPGCFRASLLEQQEIKLSGKSYQIIEKPILLSEINPSSSLMVSNSLMGLRKSTIVL